MANNKKYYFIENKSIDSRWDLDSKLVSPASKQYTHLNDTISGLKQFDVRIGPPVVGFEKLHVSQIGKMLGLYVKGDFHETVSLENVLR